MPSEPAEHMKDYINLHYFYEQKTIMARSDSQNSVTADGIKRQGLRQKDLEELKNEIAKVKKEYKKFSDFKLAFVTFTKKMNDIANKPGKDALNDSRN